MQEKCGGELGLTYSPDSKIQGEFQILREQQAHSPACSGLALWAVETGEEIPALPQSETGLVHIILLPDSLQTLREHLGI